MTQQDKQKEKEYYTEMGAKAILGSLILITLAGTGLLLLTGHPLYAIATAIVFNSLTR